MNRFYPTKTTLFFTILFYTIISFSINNTMGTAHAMPAKSTPPTAVMFYPNEVQLFVEEKLNITELPSGGMGILLSLPATANEQSFLATIGENPINNFSFLHPHPPIVPFINKALLAENEQNPERKKILQDIELAEKKKTANNAELALLRSRWSLWVDNSEAKLLSSVAERLTLEAELVKNVTTLTAQITEAEKKEMYLNNELAQYQNELALFDQQNTYVEVALRLDPAQLESIKNSAQKSIQYNYTMPGGYTSSYRLFAKPTDKTLTIDHYAILHHTFGAVWNNVTVSLSTFNRTRPLQPSLPDYWNIKFNTNVAQERSVSPVVPMSSIAEAIAPSNEQDMLGLAYGMGSTQAKQFTPVETEKGIARVWQLGKQTLAHNEDNRILLNSQKHTVEYVYTLRLHKNKNAYLTANLTLENSLELPLGAAQLIVDDTIVGNQNFSFYGTTGEIYFGEDPQVLSSTTNIESKKGQQGLISKEQTYAWHWKIKVKNQKKEAVVVIVDDSIPETKDERIKVQITSTPTPIKKEILRGSIEQTILRWIVPLEPDEEKTIEHKVQINAPENEIVSPGRGLGQ